MGLALEKSRTAALVSLVLGAILSVGLMLISGLHPPFYLVLLFIVWVAAPFAALGLAVLIFRNWSSRTRSTLYVLSIVIAICGPAIYVYVLVRPLPSQPAFPYVAAPIGMWILSAITLSIAALVSRIHKTT